LRKEEAAAPSKQKVHLGIWGKLEGIERELWKGIERGCPNVPMASK
jgi:hypothetical protein